jgi:hypothetical protein
VESTCSRGEFDLPGALFSTVGVTALVYGFIRSAGTRWADAATLAAILAGLAFLAASVAIAERAAADNAFAPVRRHRTQHTARCTATACWPTS